MESNTAKLKAEAEARILQEMEEEHMLHNEVQDKKHRYLLMEKERTISEILDMQVHELFACTNILWKWHNLRMTLIRCYHLSSDCCTDSSGRYCQTIYEGIHIFCHSRWHHQAWAACQELLHWRRQEGIFRFWLYFHLNLMHEPCLGNI